MNHLVQMYFAKRRRIRGVLNLISEKELDNPIAFSIGTHRFEPQWLMYSNILLAACIQMHQLNIRHSILAIAFIYASTLEFVWHFWDDVMLDLCFCDLAIFSFFLVTPIHLFSVMPSCLNAFYQWSTARTMFTAYMWTWRPGKGDMNLSEWSFPNLRFKFYLIVEKLAKCYNSHFGTNNVFLTEDRYLKLLLAL